MPTVACYVCYQINAVKSINFEIYIYLTYEGKRKVTLFARYVHGSIYICIVPFIFGKIIVSDRILEAPKTINLIAVTSFKKYLLLSNSKVLAKSRKTI